MKTLFLFRTKHSHICSNEFFKLCLSDRFLTPEELDGLIAYLKDKRARLVRSTADPLAGNDVIKGQVHILQVTLVHKYTGL